MEGSTESSIQWCMYKYIRSKLRNHRASRQGPLGSPCVKAAQLWAKPSSKHSMENEYITKKMSRRRALEAGNDLRPDPATQLNRFCKAAILTIKKGAIYLFLQGCFGLQGPEPQLVGSIGCLNRLIGGGAARPPFLCFFSMKQSPRKKIARFGEVWRSSKANFKRGKMFVKKYTCCHEIT